MATIRTNSAAMQALEQEVRRKLGVFAELVVGEAKRLCPVDTGVLRNSIDWNYSGPLSVAIGTPVEYGIYQELGYMTKRGRFVRNSFLLPGLRVAQNYIIRALRQ